MNGANDVGGVSRSLAFSWVVSGREIMPLVNILRWVPKWSHSWLGNPHVGIRHLSLPSAETHAGVNLKCSLCSIITKSGTCRQILLIQHRISTKYIQKFSNCYTIFLFKRKCCHFAVCVVETSVGYNALWIHMDKGFTADGGCQAAEQMGSDIRVIWPQAELPGLIWSANFDVTNNRSVTHCMTFRLYANFIPSFWIT